MPFTVPSRSPSGPRRRSLLAAGAAGAAGAGAALLAGCSESGSETTEATSAADRARARAARDSAGLAVRYEAVLTVHPGLAERLSPLRAEVVRHAEAFGGGKRSAAGPSASASVSGAAPSSAAPTASPSLSASAAAGVPDREEDALAELASAERALADLRTKALVEVPGELARLLASVAAAGAVHAYLLREGAK